jgi:hypothetical protein
MPDLLHEFWRSEERGEFGKVSEIGDKKRDRDPDLNFMFEVWAPSWNEALRLMKSLLTANLANLMITFVIPSTASKAAESGKLICESDQASVNHRGCVKTRSRALTTQQ